MVRYCRQCNSETDKMFCPVCGAPTYPTPREQPKSKAGDKFVCTIWSGEMEGISIGKVNREKYFSIRKKIIILDIEGVHCTAKLHDGFWGDCPEIRVARDDKGNNYLAKWIKKNKLYPPEKSIELKGREDFVCFEVVEPEKEFRVFLPKNEEED